MLRKLRIWYKKSAMKYYFNKGAIKPDDNIMRIYCFAMGFVWNLVICFAPTLLFSTLIAVALGMPDWILAVLPGLVYRLAAGVIFW